MRKISRIKVNKAKEYLQQAYTANEKIIQCNYILEQLQASPSKMTTSYKENIGHSGINNDVSGYVTKLIEQEEKIEAMKQEYQSKQFEISNFILSLSFKPEDEILRRLLILRYLNFKSFDEIYSMLNYSYNYIVQTMHPRALEVVERALSKKSVVNNG